MPHNKLLKADDSLIDQLCSIASVSKVVATNLLEACGNNLEMAVNMQMEGVITDTNGTSNQEDEVRAPIPQKQEVLVDGPDQLAYSFRGRNRVSRSVFDKFRDFEAEAKRQEEELMEECSTSSTDSFRKRKMRTLEDLFRPPLDLMFRGTFQSAREAGITMNKWLLVNVQNSSEFPCQVLNRDVWSNSAVKTIVQEHFVFWQIYHDSEDGQRYMNFYPVSEWPYIAVIDPRTGERLVHWQKMDAVSFCELITEFLSSHPPLDDSSNSVSDGKSPPSKKMKPNDSIIEADESAQIEAAIQASLVSSPRRAISNGDEDEDDDSDDGLETFESDSEDAKASVSVSADSEPRATLSAPLSPETLTTESEAKITNGNWITEERDNEDIDEEIDDEGNEEEEEPKERWRRYLGKETDPESRLILRLPDGSRDSVKMPSTSKLMALVLYVASKGFNNESYELVTNFPKRCLSYLDFDSSLKAVGLYPQETVFVQKR